MNQAQAKKIIQPWHDKGVEIDVHKTDVTVYHDPEEKGYSRAMDALKDIEKKLGASLTHKSTSGVHTILTFKGTPDDKGDWDDKSSKWHYEAQDGEVNRMVEAVALGKDPRKVLTKALEEGSYSGSSMGGETWKHKVVGDHIRYRWEPGRGDGNVLYLEELPGKPIKKKVRRLRVYTGTYVRGPGHSNHFIIFNIMQDAKLSSSMTYDSAKSALEHAVNKAADEAAKDGSLDAADYKRFGGIQTIVSEEQVSYLEVEPHDYEPISAKGKDFTITSKWDDFQAYSPSSELRSTVPSYQYYAPTSAQGARMLFVALKADPTILRNVSWIKFSDWCRESGIGCTTHSSVWT